MHDRRSPPLSRRVAVSAALHGALFLALRAVIPTSAVRPAPASEPAPVELQLAPAPAVVARATPDTVPLPPHPAHTRRVAPTTRGASTARATTTPAAVPAPSHDAPTSAAPRGLDVLRDTGADVLRLGVSDLSHELAHPPSADDVVRDRLRADFGGVIDDARHEQIPGASAYYQPLRAEIERAWRPQRGRAPTVGEAVAGAFFTDPDGYRRVTEAAEGDLRAGPLASAITAVESGHPNSPMLSNPYSVYARAQATARVTRTVVEVDQDATSTIVAIRVVQRSTAEGFDRSALAVIEDAVRALGPRAMPGGWRSRWLFEVTRTRNPPPIGALPSLPGERPLFGAVVGGTFDESTGSATLSTPLALNERRVVRLLWSRALSDPGAARDGGA